MNMASSSVPTTTQDLSSRWTSIPDDQLTLNDVDECLHSIPDDLWVAAACVDRLLDNVDLQRSLLELGLGRTEEALERSRRNPDGTSYGSDEDQLDTPGQSSWVGERRRSATLVSYYRTHPTDAQLCHLRTIFLDRLDRLDTYVQIAKEMPEEESTEEEIDEEWEDDPWADEANPPAATRNPPLQKPPLSLPAFLLDSVVSSACYLVSMECFSAARIMLERHNVVVWPYRFAILESIPDHIPASEYRQLLPSAEPTGQQEQRFPSLPRRPGLDWTEQPQVLEVLAESRVSIIPLPPTELPSHFVPCQSTLSSDELTAWYQRRAESIISSGFVDVALSLVQHAVSQGVADLDSLGEELSLLSRLVYDLPESSLSVPGDVWTLERWKSLTPPEVIHAYLARSTPETLAHDIRKLVMPYLFVLESRAERAGTPDPSIPTRLLYEYILGAPLDMVAAVFEASKPTLPPAQRLIRDDEDMVRLSLACLYGNDSLDEWPTMSRIFECLPAWDSAGEEDQFDEVDATISSLGVFVTPSATHPRRTPSDLLLFFKPLPFASLSRALDVLDVHLESGEIFARWSVPAPLRWFLQSNGNISEQRAWANRMARRAGGAKDKLGSQDDWEWLLEDMLKLVGSGDNNLRGAFCLLSKDDAVRIFFGGLLSAARFDIAKNMLHLRAPVIHLEPTVVEEICLASSQEFYDNASSGNYRYGEMKHAYECLDVAEPSPRIQRQKEFIEATSHLCSFKLSSRNGTPITPIEIRLTKDKLSLVSRVLSNNPEAYKHGQFILDLVDLLGFREDSSAKVKVLAMLADSALQAEDFDRAFEMNEHMVESVLTLQSSNSSNLDDATRREICEVCWVACYQLGRQPEFPDIAKKLTLIGRALEYCPADQLADVLVIHRRLEQEDVGEKMVRSSTRRHGVREISSRKRGSDSRGTVSSLASRLQELHMPNLHISPPPDAAALAGKAFRAATNFSFSEFSARGRSLLSEARGDRSTSEEGSRTRPDPNGEVTAQASRVLSKGLGWLLGEDE